MITSGLLGPLWRWSMFLTSLGTLGKKKKKAAASQLLQTTLASACDHRAPEQGRGASEMQCSQASFNSHKA